MPAIRIANTARCLPPPASPGRACMYYMSTPEREADDKQTARQPDSQTAKQASKQTNKQTQKQKHTSTTMRLWPLWTTAPYQAMDARGWPCRVRTAPYSPRLLSFAFGE
ncbi:hypothetical protein ACJQWK_03468 [Exserohilum turcicum]